MAKTRGIRGWHSMRKDQLVRALIREAKLKSKPQSKPRSKVTTAKADNGRRAPSLAKSRNALVQHHIQERDRLKDLARSARADQSSSKRRKTKRTTRDRVVLMVRDPYWLHVYWEVTRRSVERAQAALAQQWHSARPVLRVLELSDGSTTSVSESVVRQLEIHSGVSTWYVDLRDPPGTYCVDIGYLSAEGRFHAIARSNKVTTPDPGGSTTVDQNWADVAEDYERIYSQSGGNNANGTGRELQEVFEEQLRRPMGSPVVTRYGLGAEGLLNKERDFTFEVDCELIVYGVSKPDAYVTLAGDPVKLRPDGSFTVRMRLPEKRQVIPVVADSSDGLEQHTTVLAIDRNTKTLEPVIRDPND